MRSFKQIAENTRAYFASMPADHLHSEMHEHLKAHGFTRLTTWDGGTHHIHNYTHPEPYGPGWAYDHGFDPENDDAGPPVHPGQQVHEGFAQHGWQRDHMGDLSHGGVDSAFYKHPNGSTMHSLEEETDGGDNILHHIQLRILK